MLGAIAGDIIGSVYEWNNIKTTAFPLFSSNSSFTDDTVLTVAVAEVLLKKGDYREAFQRYFRMYPDAGYGLMFYLWASSGDSKPYNSFGNGSAMRVSPVGWAFDDLDAVLEEARRSAVVTHNHPEGVKGAQATAGAIFLARKGSSKEEIRQFIESSFHYYLDEPISEIRKYYSFDATCQGSVPQAIRAFYESLDFEDAVRKAISIGGDSDTIACITGGIAHAYYGSLPDAIKEECFSRLDHNLTAVTVEFLDRFSVP